MLPWEHKTTNISQGAKNQREKTALMDLGPWSYGTNDWLHPKNPYSVLRELNFFFTVLYFHFSLANLLQESLETHMCLVPA